MKSGAIALILVAIAVIAYKMVDKPVAKPPATELPKSTEQPTTARAPADSTKLRATQAKVCERWDKAKWQAFVMGCWNPTALSDKDRMRLVNEAGKNPYELLTKAAADKNGNPEKTDINSLSEAEIALILDDYIVEKIAEQHARREQELYDAGTRSDLQRKVIDEEQKDEVKRSLQTNERHEKDVLDASRNIFKN